VSFFRDLGSIRILGQSVWPRCGETISLDADNQAGTLLTQPFQLTDGSLFVMPYVGIGLPWGFGSGCPATRIGNPTYLRRPALGSKGEHLSRFKHALPHVR
jgi:hypothetical protein